MSQNHNASNPKPNDKNPKPEQPKTKSAPPTPKPTPDQLRDAEFSEPHDNPPNQ